MQAKTYSPDTFLIAPYNGKYFIDSHIFTLKYSLSLSLEISLIVKNETRFLLMAKSKWKNKIML